MSILALLCVALLFLAAHNYIRAQYWRRACMSESSKLDRYAESCIDLTREVDALRDLVRDAARVESATPYTFTPGLIPPTKALDLTDEADYVCPLLAPIKTVHLSGKIAERSDKPLLN